MRLGLGLSLTNVRGASAPAPAMTAALTSPASTAAATLTETMSMTAALTSPASTAAATLTHTAAWSPADLALTGWWEASYGGSPWDGAASAGSSGSNDLTEATNPATVAPGGAWLNGYAPALFDGSNDQMTAGGTLDTYASASTFSGWILVYLNADGKDILSHSGNKFDILSNGGTVTMDINGGGVMVDRALGTGAWKLITFRKTSSVAQIGVNEAPGAAGGASTASYSTDFDALTGTLAFGKVLAWGRYNGLVMSCGLSDTNLSDTDFGNVKSWINTRYNLAL